MKTKIKCTYRFTLVLVLLLVVGGCASAPMAVPPTAMPIPPTPTAVPPTSPSSPTTKPTLAPNVSAILTAVAPQGQSSAPRVLPQATIHVGNLDRTYLYYVPANLPRNAPLLFAFHGSGQNGEAMRDFTGFGFESLADQYGFIVVYPNGYQNSWNACRKYSASPAKTLNIDDVGFVRELVARFHTDYGINTSRVFAMGYSAGGQMAYRLAFELSDEITAIAAVAANLPTEDDFVCRALGKPIPVLLMHGTRDPIGAYNGGKTLVGGGTVRSTRESADYFAKLNGQVNPPKTIRLPHQDASDPTSVDRTVWNDAGKPEVVLITINEGGHVVPQSKYIPSQSSYGRTTRDLDGPAEIWDFFSRQQPLK